MRLFNKNRKNLKNKNEKRVYTTHRGDYKKKLDPNPHTNLTFYANPRPSEAELVTISILHLILPQ